MSVYVDRANLKFGRMVMCHMIADRLEELHEMARHIGMKRAWFQDKASFPHYDVSKMTRARAIAAGAIECDRALFVGHMRRIRSAVMTTPCTAPSAKER